MPDRVTPAISEWVAAAPDQRQRELRQAIHTILVAVSDLRNSGLEIVMKGGILLAVGYEGDRYTRDIDFSTSRSVEEVAPEKYSQSLSAALAVAVDGLPYGLDCRVQQVKLEPPGSDKHFQTLRMTVGFAPLTDVRRHSRLSQLQAVDIVSVDISYNEVITASEMLKIGEGTDVLASTLADLVAEKYRAMIQQPIRKRIRRQDAYDIYHLLQSEADELEKTRATVLNALQRKAQARAVPVSSTSLADPEVKKASHEEYALLQAEVARPLPDFETLYDAVREYYEELGWLTAPPPVSS